MAVTDAASRQDGPERLRLTPFSILRAVAILGATLIVIGIVSASVRVIGWLLAATVVAGILHPVVATLQRRVPRALALLTVVVGALAFVGAGVWGLVDDVTTQFDRLERAAPAAAREIEASERFGEAATEFMLAERVETFVAELPQRLSGGDTADALRSAATRGVAFLATFVLTLFLLIHGPRMAGSAVAQIDDADQRRLVGEVGVGAYRVAWRHLGFTALRAIGAGTFTYVVVQVIDLPGPTILGMWVAVWALVPLVGVLVGSVPVVLLAGAQSLEEAAAVLALFLGYQAAEVLIVQRRIEERSLHVGPVVTVVAGMLGLEVYGVGGLAVSWVIAVFAVAVLHEVTAVGRSADPDDAHPVGTLAADGIPPHP